MTAARLQPPLTVCVLTYGDYSHLVRRCLESIRRHTPRSLYRLVVGANAPSRKTAEYLRRLQSEGAIDRIHWSRRNLNKCPMMRRMFAGITTEFICWFDDDSYVRTPHALVRHLQIATASPPTTVMWGLAAECRHPLDFINLPDLSSFVRAAPWYRGLTPPSWDPGGQGEFNFQGRGTGDGRWQFITGGFWLIRTRAVRFLDWPDRRLVKLGDDALLGEALRQQGWTFHNTRSFGVAVSKAQRRGRAGPPKT